MTMDYKIVDRDPHDVESATWATLQVSTQRSFRFIEGTTTCDPHTTVTVVCQLSPFYRGTPVVVVLVAACPLQHALWDGALDKGCSFMVSVCVCVVWCDTLVCVRADRPFWLTGPSACGATGGELCPPAFQAHTSKHPQRPSLNVWPCASARLSTSQFGTCVDLRNVNHNRSSSSSSCDTIKATCACTHNVTAPAPSRYGRSYGRWHRYLCS